MKTKEFAVRRVVGGIVYYNILVMNIWVMTRERGDHAQTVINSILT
jgi:hypothetical protein